MLGKLIKYEFSATKRLMLPLYLVVLVMSVLNRIFISIDTFKGTLKIIPGSVMFLYVLSLIAVFVICTFYLISRFYKNYMTDEGYLMFTIPANSHQLTLSKLITSIVWGISIIALLIISILIVAYTPDRMSDFMAELKYVISQMQLMFGQKEATIFFVEVGIAAFIGFIYTTLMIYFAISLGQLFNGHKVLGAFGSYVGLYTLMQILSTIALVILVNIYDSSISSSISIVYKMILPSTIAIISIMSVIYYVGIQFILKHKLNLD